MPENYPFDADELNEELAKDEDIGPDEELNDEDIEEIEINGLPQKPSFPTGIFILAVLKDFIDLVSFGVIGIVVNIIAWIAIRLYLFRKVSFIKRWLYKKYIFTLILEFVFFINMIPQWTVFVLRAYATENKKIDQVLTAIEKLLARKAETSA